MSQIWKFNDNVDTDQIISSQYLLYPAIEDMQQFTFESIDKNFANNFQKNDIIVTGKNFGCGSSREQAPLVLKSLQAGAVIAKSFARIFFRNAINIGLPLIISNNLYDDAVQGAPISLSFEKGEIYYNNKIYNYERFPGHIMQIIHHGGLIDFINSTAGPDH